VLDLASDLRSLCDEACKNMGLGHERKGALTSSRSAKLFESVASVAQRPSLLSRPRASFQLPQRTLELLLYTHQMN
jgi:hypothetical protein